MNLSSPKMDEAGNEKFLHSYAAWEMKWGKKQQQYKGQKDNPAVQVEKQDKGESEKKCCVLLAKFIKQFVCLIQVTSTLMSFPEAVTAGCTEE